MADAAKYKEIQTIEFDREVKTQHLKKINEMLSQGWEIVDARVVQVSKPNMGSDKIPPGWFGYAEYSFILGKPR